MGIPGFQKWLLGTFPEIVRVQNNKHGQHYDHVAFDMNQIIHQAARRARDRQALASVIFRELDHILKNCVPRKSVFFAFDGPGPLAKLMTQRKRRNKSKKEHTEVSGNGAASRYAKPCIDRLEFTPGVDLLYFMRDAIEYWAYSRLQNDRKYRYIDIRISGADVPGEGELKLIDFCRAAGLPETDSIVVVGGDADIVLQGLATVPIRNFFVYLRHFSKVNGKKANYVISVWELARMLEQSFPNESSGARIDFILFSILNGNDYIPKVRGVTLGRLWRRYLSLKTVSNGRNEPPFKGQCVVDGEKRTFNWPLFHALIDNVGAPVRSVEEELVKQGQAAASSRLQKDSTHGIVENQAQIRCDDSDEELGEKIVYTGNEDGVPMDDLNMCINGDQELLEQEGIAWDEGSADFDSDSGGEGFVNGESEDGDVDEEKGHIDNLVVISGNPRRFYDTERWFRALLWTLHMYIDGYCSDYTFQYGKPYGPSCEVLSRYIKDHNGDPFAIQAPVANTAPLLPHQAAVAMLPRHAAHLLPKPLQRLVTDPVVARRCFQPNDSVDIFAIVKAINDVPRSEYSREELQRIVRGVPFLLRRPRSNDRCQRSNPVVQRPGPKFENIRGQPVIFRKVIRETTSPPCYAWPRGSIPNMLSLPYLQVGGTRLERPRREPTILSGAVKKPTIGMRSGRAHRNRGHHIAYSSRGRMNTESQPIHTKQESSSTRPRQ